MTTNYAVAPGAYLEEWLEDQGMSQGQAAARLGYSRKQINEVVNGRAPVTAQTATRLARLTGIPVEAWLRYEALYRADLARIRDEEGLARYADSIHPSAMTYLRELGATKATKAQPGQLVSDFLLVPYLVGRAGGVGLLRYRVAAEMRTLVGLRIEEFPFPLPGLGIDMVWNPHLGDRRFIGWLRRLLVDAAQP